MEGLRTEPSYPKVFTLIGVVVAAGTLHVAREIFIPIAVAVLLSFLLAPLVKRLTKWGLPNVMAVLATVAFAFSVLGVVAWLVSAQFVNLVDQMPYYQGNMQAKIARVMEPKNGVFDRAGEVIGSLKREIEEAEEADEESDPGEADPVLVRVKEPEATTLELLRQYAGPLLGPVGIAGVTAVFVIFILLQRNDLRDRFVKLVSGGNLNLATQAVDDATQRITRYLLMQMVINVTYGFPLGIGLYFIGVPNALLWGLLATLLRFLPFVGPWIAAFFPISLAIAVDPGWTMPLLVIGLVIVLELISNNVIEPWLYGSSTGISIVALLFAALVWAWIWGPIGLFLSTPLTVCLLVIGKNVPAFGYLNVILGSEPVLSMEARMYQRMLAMDPESMLDLAEEYLETREMSSFYDRVLVPALAMAERDRHAGTLAENRQQFIFRSTRELIDDIGERFLKLPEEGLGPVRVFCVPALDEADELTSLMFEQLLEQAGIAAESGNTSQTISEILREVERVRPEAVCVCAIPPGALSGTRNRCRRLHQAGLRVKLMAGIWDTSQSATAVEKRLGRVCPDLVATTFADAVAQISRAVGPGEREERADLEDLTAADVADSAGEAGRDEILGMPPEEVYDTVTRRLAECFGVPISLVAMVDSDAHFWRSQKGFSAGFGEAGESLRATLESAHLAAGRELLVVEDLAKDERFAESAILRERGIRFYAGAPLRTKSGHVVGSLCVFDTEPQTVTEEQTRLLEALAELLMERVGGR